MGFVDKKKNIEYHQTYPFRALSDWNMTWYVCVFAVCSSAVCWSGKLQRSQRPPRPRSLSGTQWVINHRGSSIFSEKEILLFVWSKVNSSPDTYFFYLFFLALIKSSHDSFIYIAQNYKSKNEPQCLFNIKHPICFDSLSGFREGKTLYLMHSRSYFVVLNYLVYPVFLNLFCLLQLQLIISDFSQNILQRATKNKQRTCCIKPFFCSKKSKSCSVLSKCSISCELHSGLLILLWSGEVVKSVSFTDNCHQMLTATFRDIDYSYIWKKNTIKFYCGSAESSIASYSLCLASCPHKKKTLFFDFPTGFLVLPPLYVFSFVSQWCLWAARSTPQKTALMLSLRSMVGVTTPPPTARGPSSSLTSREKASKRLLIGEEGSDFFCLLFLFSDQLGSGLLDNQRMIQIQINT